MRQPSWEDSRRLLGGPEDRINIAAAAVDRHVDAGRGEHVAIRWLSRSDAVRDITYADLRSESSRFATALAYRGFAAGTRVMSLVGRVPELYFSVLGALRLGAVYTPLFAAFGPEPVRARMTIGEANVLVTTRTLYERKVAAWRDELASLQLVVLVDGVPADPSPDVVDYASLVDGVASDFPVAETRSETLALVHFTSGTTGAPKGVMHVHEAVVAHHASAAIALDLRADDVYWCTADPGWVTGTSYGIIAPLTHGVTSIVDEAEFDARRWYRILDEHRVNVWYTAPTAIRMLMKAGTGLARERAYPALRFLASVGEPLNPEAVTWGTTAFGRPFHDNWWQTETGSIMIANHPGLDVRPGSMGRPLPGVTAAIVRREPALTVVDAPEETGELALRIGWPSMMRGYLHEEARYARAFEDGWYLSGDVARRDADGYFWFVGRSDDVIKSAGHLLSPFEIESALVAHAAVAEAGVVGLPDETVGEIAVAFVALHDGFEPDDTLRRELLGHARKTLGPAVAPRRIEFRETLPKTRSGKIMRRLLKARELGLPEGDTSTLETGST